MGLQKTILPPLIGEVAKPEVLTEGFLRRKKAIPQSASLTAPFAQGSLIQQDTLSSSLSQSGIFLTFGSRKSLPRIVTMDTCRSALRSSSGFPAVTMRSALLPGVSEPVRPSIPAIFALPSVAVCSAKALDMPQNVWK